MSRQYEKDQLVFVGKNTQTLLQAPEISYQAASGRYGKEQLFVLIELGSYCVK